MSQTRRPVTLTCTLYRKLSGLDPDPLISTMEVTFAGLPPDEESIEILMSYDPGWTNWNVVKGSIKILEG